MKFKPGDRINHSKHGLGTVIDPRNPLFPFLISETDMKMFDNGSGVFVLFDNGKAICYAPYYFANASLCSLVENKVEKADNLKYLNTKPGATICAACKTPLKNPMPNNPMFQYCPKCEP